MADIEMTVEIDGKDYTLKMTRDAVRWGEQNGLNIANMERQPMLQSTILFMTALRGGGTVVTNAKAQALADTYFDSCEDFTAVMGELAKMYAEVFHIRG